MTESLPQLSTDRQRDRDLLRRLCYHECGHSVVARSFGAMAPFSIKNDNDPEGDQINRLWSGRCVVIGNLNRTQKRCVGLAGLIAATIFDGDDVSGLFWRIGRGEVRLSDKDAAYAGPFSTVDLDIAVAIVRLVWGQIESEAERCAEKVAAGVPPIDDVGRVMAERATT